VTNRLWPEFDFRLATEVEDRLPRVLEPIAPAAWHTVVGLAPTEFIDEAPPPLPLVRQHEIHHVEIALAFVRVGFDVEKVGAIGRQNRLDVGSDIAKPIAIFVRRYRLEAARGIVLPLGGVGGRRDHHVRPLPVEQFFNHIEIAAVAANQSMSSDQPHVAGLRDRLAGRFGNRLFVFRFRTITVIRQQRFQLVVGESNEPEVQALVLQIGEFRGQELFLPACIFRKLVVRDDVRPPLGLAQVVQHDDGNFWEAQLPRRQQTTMAGDDPGVAVHQDWRVEAELRDGGRDLRNLGVRVRARIPGVRHQAAHRPDLDAPRERGRDGNRFLEHGSRG
jgi:hypothetical protein